MWSGSHVSLADGTFRWQAPEILEGRTDLTTEADVYSFAICCIEILTMGSVPWSALDDKAVRELVLSESPRDISIRDTQWF
jgi:abelson tyrosine-protein kinase 1/abelson tyrosine-protein kinase 2